MSTTKQDKPTPLEQLYNEHDFIDAKDNQGDWRVGYIVAKYELTKVFKVRFDGWPSKYDENYKFNSLKLKPFRTFVVGYTGQQQNPAIRQWKFIHQQHQERVQKLQLFCKQPNQLNVHELNQLIRGHNYLYIDFLMTWKYQTLQGIASALDFFLLNIKFLVQYLNEINKNLDEFLKVIQIQRDNITSISNRQAYYLSYYEIFDAAHIISGNYARLNGFFRDNGELIKEYWQDSSKKQAKRVYQTKITVYFMQLKGYDVIQSIINKLLKHQDLVPFLFLHSLTSLLNGLTTLISNADRDGFITRIITIGQNNFSKLKDHHFKDLHKHHVSNFLNAVVNPTQNALPQQNTTSRMIWSIQLQLELCLKMIGCPYFQSKLKGISHIHKTCEKNDFILKNGWFKEWMSKIKILQILFISNDNQQFIKKACQLVKFLNLKNNISDEDIQLIWQSRVGKHQTTVKEIYTLLSQLPLYESEHEKKVELYKKVSKISKEHWDEDYIKMIKEFTQNSYGIDIRQKLKQPFGFDIVYQYTKRTQSQFALGLITSLLQKIERSKIFNPFQEQCFKNIEHNQQSELHVKLLLIICNNRLDSFEKLSINMISILINFILQNSGNNNEKIISDTLQLLSEVVRSVNKQVETEQIMKLWEGLANSIHKNIFLKWLFKKKENGRVTLNHCLNEDHRKHLLTELWKTQGQIKAISQLQVLFFIELFKSVNTFHQKMKRVNIIIRPLSLQLQAYDKLWNLLRYSQKQQVIQLICEFIAQINTSYFQEEIKLAIQNLVLNISLQISSSLEHQSIAYISKLLLLTQKLILRDQQVYNYKYSPKISYIRDYTVVHIDRKQEKSHKFNCMGSFYDFKKLIAEKWGIALHKLKVYNNKRELIRLQNYFKSMNQNQYVNYKFQISQTDEQESFVKESLNKELDLFFILLDDKRIEKQVWSIVEKLPISDDLKFRILQTQNILSELEKVGFYKQLYELKVILQLSEQWWVKFISSSNLQILINNLSKASFNNHIELEYLATLTAIISKMLKLSSSQGIDLDIPVYLQGKNISLLRKFLKTLDSEGSKSLALEIKLIRNLFDIAQGIKAIRRQDDFLQQIVTNKQGEDIFLFGLITISHVQIRKKISERLKNLLSNCQQKSWKKLLAIVFLNLLEIVVKLEKRQHLREYFDFTSAFLTKIPSEYLSKFLATQGKLLCNQIFNILQQQKGEINQNTNISLVGYLCLLGHIAPYQSTKTQTNIANFVLYECLFSNTDCKCKSKKSRWQALNLLQKLFVNPAILSSTCSYLVQLHRGGKWRTRRMDDWVITLYDKMKSSTGYVGLKNLGCICYMNSFMQQLYMIPFFRHSIISCQDPQFAQEDVDENLLYQIQKMFLNLRNSDKKFYNPKQFCYAFKDYDGNPTNVLQQMDIDQFSNILFDRIQNQLKPTRQETLIKDMFGGVFSNEIVCKGCPHYSQTQQNFLSISLTVKSKKNIYQSFDTMIKGDNLDGDNAYFCERCSKKVAAVKRVSLKKLPNYLIVTLKRFQFDYQKMMKLKVNDYCEFPQNLNLREYSRQYLRKQQNKKIVDDEEDESNDYYSYILKGVVVHLGYADSGHYYSFIQDRNTSKWYQFNDTTVRDFNIQDLPEEAFGGDYGGYQAKEKIKNAYMLLYERQKKRNVQKEEEVNSNEIQQNHINKPILEQISEENKQFKIQNILFSGEYNKFINQIIDNLSSYSSQTQKSALKYAITSYLTITVREKSDSQLYSKLKKIQSQLQKLPQIKEWVVSLFSQNTVFEQFFKNCVIRQVKKTLAYWIVDLYRDCNKQCQQYFCNLILNKLVEDNQNVHQYCLILYQIAKNSNKSMDYLVSQNIIGRYIENIIRKQPRQFTQKLEVLPAVESELGKQILIQRTKHQQSVKKLRLDNENGYIWGLINMVIARSKELNIELEKYITKTQFEYLFLSDAKIYKILQEIKNKFQMYEFLNLITYLSTGNKQFLATLIGFIQSGLKDFQSKRYRQFFLLYEKVANVQDQYKQVRISAFNKIIQGLQHNEQYSLDSNIIQQWILIIVNRNQAVRNYLQSEGEILQYLFKLSNKKTPSEEVARKNGAFGEFMINKYHGVKFPRTKKAYVKISEEIYDFYQQIIDKKFVESSLWPSVLQTEKKQLKVGDVVAYFDAKDKIDYQQAKIESIFLGRLELHMKKNKVIHTWKDDEKIAFDTKFVAKEEQNDLNSSRTTQMDIDQDEQLFEDL